MTGLSGLLNILSRDFHGHGCSFTGETFNVAISAKNYSTFSNPDETK